jgi:hypothetical protein
MKAALAEENLEGSVRRVTTVKDGTALVGAS